MMNNKNMISPIVGHTLDREFAVYGDQFKFAFLPSYSNRKMDIQPQIMDSFIWMETGTEQRIAIYTPEFCKGRYPVVSDAVFQFDNLGDEPLPDQVKEIYFSGGILDCLFDKRRAYTLLENNEILTLHDDGTLEYTIPESANNRNKKIFIGKFKREVEINSINVKEIDEVYIRYTFNDPIKLSMVGEYYQLTLLLVRFLTNRFDVDFRSVKVWSSSNSKNRPDGELFIRNTVPSCDKLSDSCITFQDIGWTLINLLAIFTRRLNDRKQSHPDYSLDFIPSSDNIAFMRNETICNISGALEYEISQYDDISSMRNKEIDEFAKIVRKFIKRNYKQYNLPDSAKGMMCSGTANWSLSARERFTALAEKYEDAVEQLKEYYFGGKYYDIAAFVSHRNQLMHSASIIPSEEVIGTAMILRGLVYCSILGRAGLDKEFITQLCIERRIDS